MIRGLAKFVKQVFSFLFPRKARHMVMQEVYSCSCEQPSYKSLTIDMLELFSVNKSSIMLGILPSTM
jgi:hypothetical protein